MNRSSKGMLFPRLVHEANERHEWRVIWGTPLGIVHDQEFQHREDAEEFHAAMTTYLLREADVH